MHRKHLVLVLVSCMVGATGCRRLSHSAGISVDRAEWNSKAGMGLDNLSRATGLASLERVALAAAPERYIAESHKIEVIAAESELEKSWQALVTFCGAIQCEVVSSTLASKTSGDSTPSGTLTVRVGPADLSKLLAQVQKLGKIAQHTTQSEDKTTAVIDTDAKIKNLTTFRDNLRAMLAKPSATVKDLIEIQQQLMETQSQLDSEAAQRKVLANETEKIVVELTLRVEAVGRSSWSQIGAALRESSSILAESTAAVITTVVAVIPWLILIVPGVWVLRKIWRKFRRKRATSQQTLPAAS
jgi:hypothetical protein